MIPDRAIMPLAVALMGGFTIGMIDSILQKQGAPVVTLAVIGAVASAVAGAASVIGVCGRDRGSVALLRAFYGAALFLCIDLGLQAFLRDGRFLLMLVLLLGAAGCTIMLVIPRADPGHERHGPHGGAPQATA